MSRVRLLDVAQRVGVSAKTVSNVVNGTGWVSEAVRTQVLEAIEELGYRPNVAARQLRSGQSGLLGLCVPNLRDPYFAELASELIWAAEARDLTVLVTQSNDGDLALERAAIEGTRLPALDGLVLSSLALTPRDLDERRSTVPLVLIGEHGEQLASETVTHIGPDNQRAAQDATEHLLSLGRTRIAAIGVQRTVADTAVVRLEGYRRAVEGAGLPLDPDLLVEVSRYNRAEGSRAVEMLLAAGRPFDGVFCFNDALALGALHTLGMRGVSVPDDVAVVGFDNIDEGRFTLPPLPTVDSGVARSSSLMIDLLVGTGDVPRGGRVVVDHELVLR